MQPSTPSPTSTAQQRASLLLAGSMVITGILYFVPFLRWAAWPLRQLATLAHELGHGLAAIAVGGRFEALLLYADGSGVATWTALVSRLGHATIAAGGLVGPALAAAVLLVAGRTPRAARITLVVVGAGLVIADILVVRTLFGGVFVAVVAAGLLALGITGSDLVAQAGLVFVSVQLALSVFSRADYLFTPMAHTGQGAMPSDVAQIQEALVLPYWFWGGLCGLLSMTVVGLALVMFLRQPAARSRGS